MKQLIFSTFIILCAMLKCSSQDAIVYWKRYTSIDILTVGVPLNNPNYYNYKNQVINVEVLSINVGLLKKWYTPFLNFCIEGEHGISLSQAGYTMVAMRLGTFIYKSKYIESNIASGFAWNPNGNNASTSSLRLLYKPRKWFGIGLGINANVNKDRCTSGGRVILNFGSGL